MNPVRNLPAIGFWVVLAGIMSTLLHPLPSGAATPIVSMSPSSDLHDQETVTVAVGPNSVFTPHARVNILECADPGGTAAGLPTSDSTCDGNTIQGTAILVALDGSFSESGYTVYALPSSALGEQANFQPVCNESSPCVLYIGQNQNDFTAPKVFSQPFTVAPASDGKAGPSATGAVSAATTTPATVSATATAGATSPTGDPPGVSLVSGGTLPNTGVPAGLLALVAAGTVLAMVGAVGRRAAMRSGQ